MKRQARRVKPIRTRQRMQRLIALSINLQNMVDQGEVSDYAEIARLGYFTRARLTQIMNLLRLALEIQEAILMQVGDNRLHDHRRDKTAADHDNYRLGAAETRGEAHRL